MKNIGCADMPGNDGTCSESVSGETTQDCIDKMMAHAAGVHADKLATMTPEMQGQMGQFRTQFLDAQA